MTKPLAGRKWISLLSSFDKAAVTMEWDYCDLNSETQTPHCAQPGPDKPARIGPVNGI